MHDMAFGSGLKESNIPKLIEHANKELEDVDFGSSTVEVDAHFEFGMPKDLLLEFAEVSHIYGNGIPQPKFVFDIMIAPGDFAAIGSDKKTLRINAHGTTFIAFRAGDTIDYLNENLTEAGYVRVIGRPEINEFNGRKSVQIHIDQLEKLDEEVSLF